MEFLKTVWAMVQGYKTQSMLLLALILSVLQNEMIIDPATYDTWMAAVGPLGGAAFVDKVNRIIQVARSNGESGK